MTNPLLRTLISEMVETYLEESYEDNVIESIFEEVSDETWEAIEEAILSELSPATLDSYKNKAFKQLKRSADQSRSALKQSTRDKHTKIADKRNKGVGSVLKRGMVNQMNKGTEVDVPRGFRSGDYKGRSMTGKTPEQMKADRDNK